jgi:hypothetical protein
VQYKDDVIIEAFDEDSRQGRHKVIVRQSRFGFMANDQAVPFSFDRRQLRDQINRIEQREMSLDELKDFGRMLADWLLPDVQPGGGLSVRDRFTRTLDQVGNANGVRLRLVLSPTLKEIAWEYLYLEPAGGGQTMLGFLALNRRIAIVRDEALDALNVDVSRVDVLTVVAAFASPDYDGLDREKLDLATEQANMQLAFAQQSGLALKPLPDAKLDDLLEHLRDASVFHFSGHGDFRERMGDQPRTTIGDGRLALQDAWVSAEQLAVNLRNAGVQLVVLGGCETGQRGGMNNWGSVAPALIQANIPAVVANQFRISDQCAIAFSKHFYLGLVGGDSIELAIAAGRIAAYNKDPQGREWGTPVLYLRAANGVLFAGVSNTTVREQAQKLTHQLQPFSEPQEPEPHPEPPPLDLQAQFASIGQLLQQSTLRQGQKQTIEAFLGQIRDEALKGDLANANEIAVLLNSLAANSRAATFACQIKQLLTNQEQAAVSTAVRQAVAMVVIPNC